MAQKKTQRLLEQCALAIVVLFPLSAIIWYVFFSNPAPAATAPTQTVTQSVAQTPTQQAPAPATASIPVGTVTLDDPASLPTSVAAAQIVPFSFTIKNTGSGTSAFPYKVYVKWNSGEEDVIDENTVTLAAGATTDLSEALKFETAAAKGEVYILLQPSVDTISFAMPRA